MKTIRVRTTQTTPMQPGLDSLNVSAAAAIILFEKVRQERVG
ncbi:MAG: hypothetical protein ABH807_02750 [Candidatus Shapirobacteria bacterium]